MSKDRDLGMTHIQSLGRQWEAGHGDQAPGDTRWEAGQYSFSESKGEEGGTSSVDSCRAPGRRVPRDTIRFEGGEVLVTLERDFSGESRGTNLTAEAREYVGGKKWKSQLFFFFFFEKPTFKNYIRVKRDGEGKDASYWAGGQKSKGNFFF